MKPKIVLVPLDGSRLREEALAPATGFALEGAAVEAAYSTLIRYPIGDESEEHCVAGRRCVEANVRRPVPG
jgi:hypothetical protein